VVKESKLPQANGPSKDEHNDATLPATGRPKRSTESLNAEEKQIVIRMRKDAFFKLRIAEYLGRDLQVVHDVLRRVFKTSAAERLGVARLRKDGNSWEDIIELMFPGWNLSTIYRHFLDVQGKQVGRKRRVEMTAADCLDVDRLRKEGKPWAQITELKIPGWNKCTIHEHFRKGITSTGGETDVEGPPQDASN
jgi:hypothetical protein